MVNDPTRSDPPAMRPTTGEIAVNKTTATFSAPGISSGHCEAAIIEQLAGLRGIESVVIDLEARLVRVGGGQEIDDAAVIAAIYEAGYEAVRA